MIIAIDGLAASGKSTTAKLVAKKLSITYLDTGAMYRAVTLQLLRSKIDFDNIDKVSAILDDMIIDMYDYKGANIVKLNDEDISEQIRSVIVTKHVSEVSSLLFFGNPWLVCKGKLGIITIVLWKGVILEQLYFQMLIINFI